MEGMGWSLGGRDKIEDGKRKNKTLTLTLKESEDGKGRNRMEGMEPGMEGRGTSCRPLIGMRTRTEASQALADRVLNLLSFPVRNGIVT